MDDMTELNDIQECDNKQITIGALREKTLNLISSSLNPFKIIPTDNGLSRDWRGLAELCNINSDQIASTKNNSNPSQKILNLWYENGNEISTIERLLTFLEKLDRFDIIEDITVLLDEDIKNYKKNPSLAEAKSVNLGADKYILTRDDVSRISEGLEPQNYDAFVLFADDDIDFATELIETMEKQYNLKFCVKDRDLVAGVFEYEVMIKLITERCNRLIVILSPSFFDSSANKFFLSFAQSLGVEQRHRKVIPCVYKPCNPLPSDLSCYFLLDYRRAGKLWNFWDKLRDSINAPNVDATDKLINDRYNLHNIQSSNVLQENKNKSTSYNNSALKPVNHVVKFSSMVNLNTNDNESVVTEQNLSPSTSANNLELYSNNGAKIKTKSSFLKKLLRKNNSKNDQSKHKNKSIDGDKEKRGFWSKHKRKVVNLAS